MRSQHPYSFRPRAFDTPDATGPCPVMSAAALPFAGLGIDLSAVVARSRVMQWRPKLLFQIVATRAFRPLQNRRIPPIAGFALLVRLGREIRGR